MEESGRPPCKIYLKVALKTLEIEKQLDVAQLGGFSCVFRAMCLRRPNRLWPDCHPPIQRGFQWRLSCSTSQLPCPLPASASVGANVQQYLLSSCFALHVSQSAVAAVPTYWQGAFTHTCVCDSLYTQCGSFVSRAGLAVLSHAPPCLCIPAVAYL